MNKLTIDDVELKGKKVLVRVDFNVPLDENQNITDDIRITSALPTIEKIIASGGKIILMSHLGRPKGQVKPELSLKPVALLLQRLLNSEVKFVSDCIGEQVQGVVNNLKDGEVLLLENLRFHKEETDNSPEFAKALASLSDVYVNDAFGSAHRAHASTEGVTKYISTCVAGYLMQKELEYLGKALGHPERPFTAVLGGAKISGKIDVIENLLPKIDNLLIGGGMIFTFFKAMGYEIGKSLLEEDRVEFAKELLTKINNSPVKFILPEDVLVSYKFENEANPATVDVKEIPKDKMGMDIGEKTSKLFTDCILQSKTVVWNGPMGVFEFDNFASGTFTIAEALAKATDSGATTIVGGGDSAASIKKIGLQSKISHVSTGGGASLEFLEGKALPGVAALSDLL